MPGIPNHLLFSRTGFKKIISSSSNALLLKCILLYCKKVRRTDNFSKPMSITEFLMTIVPFEHGELKDIVAHFKKETIPKNQILVRQGEICQALYFIEKGMGRSYYLNENGKEITQWFFGVGKFMSSVDSFFQQRPSLYYLEVLEDAELYSISKTEIDQLFAKYHQMEKMGRLVTTEMLTQVVNKLNAIQFQTAKERYDYMLAEFPDIAYHVPLGHIASYLGMTQETLSRIRKG